MLDKIYGIDYNTYDCGGINNVKIFRMDKATLLFDKESEMLKELAELKNNHGVGEISVFESQIVRNEYKI